MKRVLTAVAIAAAVLVTAAPASAQVTPAHACRFQHLDQGTWTHHEVKVTVRCLAKRMNVDVRAALYIADRESNFYRFAWNHSTDCRGIYQHMYKYWAGRVSAHADKLNKYAVRNRTWSSPRAQAVVTFAMAKAHGWGPWQ